MANYWRERGTLNGDADSVEFGTVVATNTHIAVGDRFALYVKVYDAAYNFLLRIDEPDSCTNCDFGRKMAINSTHIYISSSFGSYGTLYVYTVAGVLVRSIPGIVTYEMTGNIACNDSLFVPQNNAPDPGSIDVYNADGSAVLASIQKEASADGTWFGYAVAVSDNYVFIASDDTVYGNVMAGRLYAYAISDYLLKYTLNGSAAYGFYADRISAKGDTLVLRDASVNPNVRVFKESGAYIGGLNDSTADSIIVSDDTFAIYDTYNYSRLSIFSLAGTLIDIIPDDRISTSAYPQSIAICDSNILRGHPSIDNVMYFNKEEFFDFNIAHGVFGVQYPFDIAYAVSPGVQQFDFIISYEAGSQVLAHSFSFRYEIASLSRMEKFGIRYEIEPDVPHKALVIKRVL